MSQAQVLGLPGRHATATGLTPSWACPRRAFSSEWRDAIAPPHAPTAQHGTSASRCLTIREIAPTAELPAGGQVRPRAAVIIFGVEK